MRKALTHYCNSCNWQQTEVFDDGERTMKESLDHYPWCRSLYLLVRRATRLETLAASFSHQRDMPYCRDGKWPRKGLDSPYKWRQQSAHHFATTGK